MVLFPRAAHAARAQGWSGDQSFGGTAVEGAKHFAEPFYGAATNGISGGIRVALGVGRPLVVSVFVTNANLQETSPMDDSATNPAMAFIEKVEGPDWLYYMPTNSFCGPIELRDVRGSGVPPIEAKARQTNAYPAQYDLSLERSNYLHRKEAMLGPGLFPDPVLGIASTSELIRFEVGKYFDLKEPGEYKLTVWPKIYRRIATNNEVCRRIDVPPVSATLKWP